MDFTIVKIMNELGVSEEEARALVEFDLKHKKGEEIGKIEKSVLEVAGAEQLTKNTKNVQNIQSTQNNTNNTQTTKTAENTKDTETTESDSFPNTNFAKDTNTNPDTESVKPQELKPTPKISTKEISETRNVEIFEFENENSKSKFKKQSFISEIENQILENYIGIEFPQNLNSTSVSFKVDGKYYTLKLTEHKSKPAGFKE